jgi:hypothetical protein
MLHTGEDGERCSTYWPEVMFVCFGGNVFSFVWMVVCWWN